MKFSSSFLTAATFAISISAVAKTAQPNVATLKLAPEIRKAIDENYAYGRRAADFGGVSEVKVYKIDRSSATGLTLADALVAVIQRRDNDLSLICADIVGYPNARECVAKLLTHYDTADGYVDTLSQIMASLVFKGENLKPAQTQFNQDLRTIESAVTQIVGDEAFQINLPRAELNADAGTQILIAPDLSSVAIVEWDLGA